MNNKSIRKVAVTLATLQALSLSGCRSNNIEGVTFSNPILTIVEQVDERLPKAEFAGDVFVNYKSDNIFDINEDVTGIVRMYNKNGRDIGFISGYHRVTAISTNGFYSLINIDGEEVYVNNSMLLHVPDLSGNFQKSDSSKVLIISDTTRTYDKNGKFIGTRNKDVKCHPILSNGYYTLVEFDDNTEAFINSDFLIPAERELDKYAYVTMGTTLYTDDELKCPIYQTDRNCILHVSAYSDKYAVVSNDIDGVKYYVDLNQIRVLDYNSPEDLFAYVSEDTEVYCNMDMNIPYYTLDKASLVYVINNNGVYAEIYDLNYGRYAFVPVTKLNPLEDHFIDIDLSEQRMTCYNYKDDIQVFRTRTGKDSTPTHTGVNYIDWKATNWEFTNYPGSRAQYWIPYDEVNGEGIHDLIGDDTDNYGNHSYHDYGSHGCVRTTPSGSEFVYNNYEVGDLVLVHK